MPELSDGYIDSCPRCGAEAIPLFAEDEDGEAPWICRSCFYDVWDRFPDENATAAAGRPTAQDEEQYGFESDYGPIPDSPLVLPPMRDRDVRLVSFEQEVASGGQEIARRLHEAGYASDAIVHGYGSGTVNGFCHVEHDSSVDTEIIYSRLNLSKNEVAARLEGALNTVRGTISDGHSRLTLQCGGHIHVDLGSSELEAGRRYGMEDVESLYHVWNHLEDVIYRLGAANWSFHRTMAGNHYVDGVRKGLGGRGNIGRYFEETRGAINFANFLASRGYCRCGAFTFEDWSACTCDLPKATVEFRVFNSTANLRKIHAYTALSLALVEFSKRNTVRADDLPVNGWTATVEPTDYDQAQGSLSFLFKELPLTHKEKMDLLYCAERSSLKQVAADMPTIRRNRRREEVETAVTA